MSGKAKRFRLLRRGARVFIQFADSDVQKPVKLVWARPITGRGGALSLLDDKKKEVAMLENLDCLDGESRRIAEEELGGRYLIPRITRVIRASANFGVRYWHVETDLGVRQFALKNANKNAVWVSDEHLVLQDTLGCRYEVKPFSALDPRSRAEVDKVI